MNRKQRTILLLVAFWSGVLGASGVIFWQADRQEQLNRRLIAAVRRKEAPTVVALLNLGADANAREGAVTRPSLWSLLWSRLTGKTSSRSHAATAMAIACGYSTEDVANSPQPAIVAALLAKGADVNGKDPDGNPVIIRTIRWLDAPCVQILLNAGADPNAADAKGTPALLAAVGGYDSRTSQKKLPNGQTIIDMSIGHRWLNASEWKAEYFILKALMDKGAKIEATCYGGGTALHWVSKDDYVAAVRLLIARGANVNARDDYGDTPLIVAGGTGCSGTVRFLLAHGAAIDARNDDGETALLQTAAYGYPEIVKMLLAHGADLAAKDNKGRGVLKIVRQGFNDAPTYRLLRRAGARK